MGVATGLPLTDQQLLVCAFPQIGATSGTPVPPFEVQIGWVGRDHQLYLLPGADINNDWHDQLSDQDESIQAVKMGETL
jgi:hypothetical protein